METMGITMFKRIQSILLLALIATAAKAELPADYQVVVLTENFPPFNMSVDNKNFAQEANITGINSDIVREMFKRAKINYNLTLRFPWDRIYSQVLSQPNQAIYSTTYTPAREPLFKWVGPLSNTGWVLLAAPGSDIRLTSLEQARQYRIGAYKNGSVSQHLEDKGLEPINALKDQDNVAKLLRGEIDMWATTDPVGPYWAKQEGVAGLVTALRFNDAEQFLALNKDTPDEVVKRLQSALNQMRADGTIDEIRRRYL